MMKKLLLGAVDTVLKVNKGEPYEKKTFVPFELVTQDNLAQYEAMN